MPFLEEEQIEARAQDMLAKLSLSGQRNPDMMTAIVKLKHMGAIKDYLRVPDVEMPDDLAAYDPDQRLLKLQESTFCSMNRNEPRGRFSIAHEFGHIWLRHKKTRHRNASGRRIEAIAPTIRRDEYQADRFAGAYLAPENFADHQLTPAQLTEQFMLSPKTATIRKEELERLYRRRHDILRPVPDDFMQFLRELQARNPRR